MADVDILILTQKALNDQIDKARINHGKANSETKQGKKYYATRIQSLEKLWQAFTETHIAIWSTENGADSEYAEGNLYEETEELYINLKSKLSQELEESFPTLPHTEEQPSTQATHPPRRETRLPPIQIPTFDGNYKSWHTVHDLFNSLIHKDPNLSKVQKLHYLKLSVTGEAERLLRQFEVIDTNYTKAWELLQKRFDNKRVLVNTHLKSLLSQPAIKTESAHAIRSLLDLTEESLHELKYLGLPVEHWDAILIYNLVQRLPSETHQLWEHEQGNKNELPTYADLSVFLETRFRTLEALQECQNNKAQNRSPSYIEARVRTREPRSGYKPDSHISATQKNHAHKNAYSFLNKPHTCAMCKQNHTLFHCTSFRKLHPKERINFIQRNKLCKNCLAAGHNLNGCPSQKTCLQCQKRHNSLLHLNQPSETNTTQNQRQAEVKHTEPNGSNEPAINTFFSTNVSQALLSTALVNIESPNGQIYTLRALIDSGSQVSFITEAASKRLKLQTKPTHVEVTGLGKIQTAHVNKHTTFKLKSLHTKFEISVNALILRRITDFVPADTINITNLLYLQHLQLADPRFHTPGQIDVLLGADIYAEIIDSGVIKGSPGDPTAQCTHLGWILMGKLKGKNKSSKVESLTVQIHPDCQLEQQLKRFWEIEEVPTIIAHPDNVLCERLYAESHKRLSQGQYQVKLPFRQPDGPDLGHTRQMAVKQYLQLEKRFEKQPELHAQYKKCIQEYLRLGHMVEIKPNTAEQTETERISHYYLPHHAVIKESSTTKLRVVFNASAKSSNGRSLNEQMLAGPTIQPTLWATILKWRLYKIAFTADIEKMYRMVQMHPDHTDFQRIVWRDSRSEPIKDYKLTTVTFGTTSAPFLAIRTLHQLSKDEQDNYPLAAQSLKTDFYVDDLLTGAHNVKTGLTLQNELISVLSKAGFNLRKWTANHPELIKNIPLVDRENNSILDLSEKDTIKTLGLQWHPASDEFSFKVTPSKKETHFTKRTILSETASLFDPLGWLAPIIIIAKIFIQTLWLSKCSWDEILPDTTTAKWAEFRENLNDIDEIRIPRWIKYSLTSTNLEVHGFCDASEKAFASVVYLRIIDENGAIFTHLFTSKTRVAPTKTISLPRLELCGAVLLARVIKQIKIDLNLTDCSTFAWSDSEVTLSWIQKQPSSWKTFVAHRVAEIQEVIHPRSWRYVPSRSNPADCATRGIYPRELIQSKLWWNGPSWLQEPTEKWPEQPSFNKCYELETRPIKALTCTNEEVSCWLTKYSSFPKLVRIIAFCKRFYTNCRTTSAQRKTQYLTFVELQEAENTILSIVQQRAFPNEFQCLNNNKPISKASRLLPLNPFMCKNKLIRVGGRLERSLLSYNQKHPIILPNNHYVTHVIIDHTHRYTLHGGTQLTLNTLRNKYWLLNARNTIRQRIRKCIPCFKAKPVPSTQIMGNLPAARITPTLAFEHTGVDYAGPIEMKTSRLRNAKIVKGYLSIFVCMATKAIHIEVVSDLTTAAFIAALKRFISRRGLCSHIYSDCGTNFVGASKELSSQFKNNLKEFTHDSSSIAELTGITWHFNPPSAPHFGGLWEAGVKAIKTHMKRTLQNSILTFEELSTVTCQIEACVNSRPLSPLSNDPTDFNVLTPGHFLVNRNLKAIPEPSMPENITSLKRWQYIQALTQQFWNQWSKEYLINLQSRKKWQTPEGNLQINDLVLIQDHHCPTTKWPMGRIIQIHPGHDRRVRVATIKTPNNQVIRPITKLYKLPI